ncbi:MAG TPA: hypothetical protein EYP74_02195 [Anaerolineales bacterium]|nr:hypothetical protein [Anaerolineales bacterium]
MNKKYLYPLIAILIIFTLSCNFLMPESTPSAEPENVPTAEVMATEAEISATQNGVCNNILYPLLAGQQMVYKSTSPKGNTQMGMTVAKVEGNFATIDMVDMSTGIITQSMVECDAGAIKYFPAVSMGTVLGDMLDGEMTMEYVSGYIAPTEETLVANNWDMAWESEYVMNGEITMEDEGEAITVTIDNSPVLMKWQIVSTGESVTVEAGTYINTIKVTRDMTMGVSLDMGGMKLDSVLIINSTHFFEPYIGMVKMEIDEVSIKMNGMTFPITLSERMELVEFRPTE